MTKNVIFAWALGLAAGLALAQTTPPPGAAPSAIGAVQSQNIFTIQPDASADAGYAEQTNGARALVQPGNNAPMWRQVGSGVTGYSSLPIAQAPEAGNLIQPFVQYPGSRWATAGEAWRQVRNNWIIPYGAALIGIAALGLALLFFGKGPMGQDHARAAAKIERFTPFERAAHWTNAIAFCILAVSGLVMAFGKYFLLPILGSGVFGWLTYLLKTIHNFVGPLFAVSLCIVVLVFIKDNILTRSDFVWLSKAGGFFGGHHVPAHRFNAGEKGLFWWGITLPGLLMVGSGLVLDKLVPGLGLLRSDMQIAHLIHAAAGMWMMALILGHIYMGTVGVRGAYKAMKTGYVSAEWAKEHHDLWYRDIQAGKIPAQRTVAKADAPSSVKHAV